MPVRATPDALHSRRDALRRLAWFAAAGTSGIAGCGGGASLTAPPVGAPTVTAEGVTLSALAGTPHWTAASHGKLKTAQITANLARVFDSRVLQRLDLVIENVNWQLMQRNLAALKVRRGAGSSFSMLEDPVTVPCTVKCNGVDWYKVGVRYKGSSSLYGTDSNKLPFKLKFNEFEAAYPALDGQRFHGFKTLHLKNNFHDDSELRELLADDLMRGSGLASAHAGFVQLYIDVGDGSAARYFGLYTLVEDIEDTVLKTQGASDGGNLYKPEDDAARFAPGTFDTAELGLKNNRQGASHADVRALFDAINHSALFDSDRAAWKLALEAVFDVPRFLKWLAANTVMQNWDAYGSMPHNYYLYNHAGRLQWIPWDHNEALAFNPRAPALSLAGVPSSWPLIYHLARDSAYFTQYRAEVRSFAIDVFDTARLQARVQTLADLIAGAVAAELPGYTLTSASRFTTAVATLKDHIAARQQAALAFAP